MIESQLIWTAVRLEGDLEHASQELVDRSLLIRRPAFLSVNFRRMS